MEAGVENDTANRLNDEAYPRRLRKYIEDFQHNLVKDISVLQKTEPRIGINQERQITLKLLEAQKTKKVGHPVQIIM